MAYTKFTLDLSSRILHHDSKMISDDELYRLAIFLGSAAMLLIILYHFLEVNAVEEPAEDSKVAGTTQTDARVTAVGR